MANRLSSGFPKRIECDSNNYLKTAVGRCAHRNVLFLLWQRDLKRHTRPNLSRCFPFHSPRKQPLLGLNMGLIPCKQILGLQDMFRGPWSRMAGLT